MRRRTWMGLSLLLLSLLAHTASIPLWTFTPLTSTTGTPGDTIQYRVTSQTNKPHTLELTTPGVSQITTGTGVCANPFVFLRKKDSCILSLLVDGSNLRSTTTGGPVVCQQGSGGNQCYQPSEADTLQIYPLTISPTTGPTAGYTGVLIGGLGFTGATRVTFGGVNAIAFSVLSDTSITAVTPPHAAGSVDVVVETTTGSKTITSAYTYTANVAGDAAAGGVIGCFSGSDPTLILAAIDPSLSSEVAWDGDLGATENQETGAVSTTDGALNTSTIVSAYTSRGATVSTYPAGICSTYSIDEQGNTPCDSNSAVCYDNWFLPATSQLACLCAESLTGYLLWTSTEADATTAVLLDGLNGCTTSNTSKDTLSRYGCVQAYPPSIS